MHSSMATTTLACFMALVLPLITSLLILLLSEGAAAATSAGIRTVQERREIQSLLRQLNKPPVATFESPDGDIIDCVHISKQPAFDHPLLNGHTIQMQPSYHPQVQYEFPNTAPACPLTKSWHQSGNCPDNTIPIRRTREEDVMRASSIRRFGKERPRSMPFQDVLSGHRQDALGNNMYHDAYAYALGDNMYYGTEADV